jgi:tRNA-specific 2-thiouridylase
MSVRERKTKVIAAMSGGVDSSVAAALCIEQGFDVTGVTLKFFDCGNSSEKTKSCCGFDDHRQVVNVCEKLGIPHYLLDAREIFSRMVLKTCWDEYGAGRTPNPCALCNRHIKFSFLIEYAGQIGADGIITGHYAKIAKSDDGKVLLKRANDAAKDQSYFLSFVKAEDLAETYMPLCELDKSVVREKARNLGLSNAEKAESQDACLGYIGEKFAETLRKAFNGTAKPGNFIDDKGNIIGRHDGIHNFTIGQRRGFGRGFGMPVFVKDIDNATGSIVLTSDEKNLFSNSLKVKDINWLLKDFSVMKSFRANVQIRYRHKAVGSEVFISEEGGGGEVFFDNPQRAVTPGQLAVFYDGDIVIGAGWVV